MAVVFCLAVPDALIPRQLLGTVEDDEVTFVNGAYCVHVLPGLLQAFLYLFFQVSALQFQL